MAIECYYSWCPFHASKHEVESGPYCYEVECRCSGWVEKYSEYNEGAIKKLEFIVSHTGIMLWAKDGVIFAGKNGLLGTGKTVVEAIHNIKNVEGI